MVLLDKHSLLLIICFLALRFAHCQEDPFLTKKYDHLHWSPTQEKFRKIAPMPAGVVYVQRPGEGEPEIRAHLQVMKQLGFNALKQIMPVPGWTIEEIQLIALEEGLIPWWYGEGGWEPITDSLLQQLNLPTDLPIAEIRRQPEMISYQMKQLRQRVERTMDYLESENADRAIQGSGRAFEPRVGGRGVDLSENGKDAFVKWAKEQYERIDSANFAYNLYHANLGQPYDSWKDFENRWQDANHREYRIKRDIFRFKADYSLDALQQKIDRYKGFYPHAPFRGGGELGLFLPQSWYCVDLEGIADLMKDAGSFYPSIHFSWHYDQVHNELLRPMYMQTSFANDIFKGGWAATWESTGGPQQFDGEKYGRPKGFTVDEGTMTQFVLSQIAGGLKGFGIWSWSARSAGKEAGEYSLLDRNNEVTLRAVKVGKIAQAMNRYRDELWAAHKEPLVGVLYNWDNEGIWAAMSVRGRDTFRQIPINARVGVSRALINANVPFEYVTADDIRNGLAPRYRIIYLPAMLAINHDLLARLADYVRRGGRLIMDLPGAWYDEYGAMLITEEGSLFEELFGVEISDFQYSGHNRQWILNGMPLEGFTARFSLTGARALATYDNGLPAVTEHQYGKGSAIILGFGASGMCFSPGQQEAERILLDFTLGDYESPYTCEGAIVYRLAGPQADHYFLLNDGEARSVFLNTKELEYTKFTDTVTGEVLEAGQAIQLERHSGRWLRFEK